MLGTLGYHNILSVPWIAAANLIAGRRVVPEFCFHRPAGWDDVLAAARELWLDGPARTAAIADLRHVRERLGRAGATARVAAVVTRFLQPEAG
jgi:lipid A disaccharide synthetase